MRNKILVSMTLSIFSLGLLILYNGNIELNSEKEVKSIHLSSSMNDKEERENETDNKKTSYVEKKRNGIQEFRKLKDLADHNRLTPDIVMEALLDQQLHDSIKTAYLESLLDIANQVKFEKHKTWYLVLTELVKDDRFPGMAYRAANILKYLNIDGVLNRDLLDIFNQGSYKIVFAITDRKALISSFIESTNDEAKGLILNQIKFLGGVTREDAGVILTLSEKPEIKIKALSAFSMAANKSEWDGLVSEAEQVSLRNHIGQPISGKGILFNAISKSKVDGKSSYLAERWGKDYFEGMKRLKRLNRNMPENFSEDVALAYWTESHDIERIKSEKVIKKNIGDLDNIPFDHDLSPKDYARLYLAAAMIQVCQWGEEFKDTCDSVFSDSDRLPSKIRDDLRKFIGTAHEQHVYGVKDLL